MRRAAADVQAEPDARVALEELAGAYWQPVYALLRRRGHSREAAEDLTQGFFTMLIERRDLGRADATRGHFRAFLATCATNFAASQVERERALKRGSGERPLSLEIDELERRLAHERADDDPALAFERDYALTLLERTLESLRLEAEERGRGRLFEALKSRLAGTAGRPYEELARELDTTVGALKVATHRLRARYGELLRNEIAHTLDERAVADPRLIDDEIGALFTSLSTPRGPTPNAPGAEGGSIEPPSSDS